MSARRRIVGPGNLPLDDRDDTRMSDAGSHMEPERPQVVGDLRGRADFAVRKLGMAMEIAAPFDDPRSRWKPWPQSISAPVTLAHGNPGPQPASRTAGSRLSLQQDLRAFAGVYRRRR